MAVNFYATTPIPSNEAKHYNPHNVKYKELLTRVCFLACLKAYATIAVFVKGESEKILFEQ